MTARELKVGGSTNVNKLSGSILSVIEEGNTPELIAVGAIAVNQAVKACIVARGNAYKKGRILSTVISFTSVTIGGERRDAIKIRIEEQ